MWYILSIVILICCAYSSAAPLITSDYSTGQSSSGCTVYCTRTDASPQCMFLVQTDKPTGPAQTAQGQEKQNSTSEDTPKQEEPPPQKDKKPPPKDFVPSEKIDADKAVDFPADI